MYNIITFKGELMKKLLILTVLFSAANLAAVSDYQQAQGILSGAQGNLQQHLARTQEAEAGLKALFAQHQKQPEAISPEQIEAAVAAHNELSENCRRCVHEIQEATDKLNAAGFTIEPTKGVFAGRVIARRS